MSRTYYVFCLIPLILVSAFFLVDKYGPGGQTGLDLVLYLGEAIVIACPVITFAGLLVIGTEFRNHNGLLGPFIATIVAALPGIIFWIIEHGGNRG